MFIELINDNFELNLKKNNEMVSFEPDTVPQVETAYGDRKLKNSKVL